MDGPRDLEGYGDGSAGATRANGLTASYYVPLRDVDPRVGDELLTKLGGAGIAAYVAPTPGRHGPYGDVTPPGADRPAVGRRHQARPGRGDHRRRHQRGRGLRPAGRDVPHQLSR